MIDDQIKNIFYDKSIKLFCTGPSLDEVPILQKTKDELWIGVNRILHSDMLQKEQIDVIIHNGSLNYSPLECFCDSQKYNEQMKIIFTPNWKTAQEAIFQMKQFKVKSPKNIMILEEYVNNFVNKYGYELYTGLLCLKILIESEMKKVEVFGMDNYKGIRKYCGRLHDFGNSSHNTELNENVFSDMRKHENIKINT